jgi:phosphoribosyl-AMP cyclohydrolase
MELDFEKTGGLIPVVVQDSGDQRVLMVGFMNEEALKKTVEIGKVTFWSRSRNELWTKGGSSGNYLVVKEIQTDCDNDTLLIQVESLGPGVCHNGYRSCFYRRLNDGKWQESEKPTYDPKAVYKK